jgi:hypothetical protein
MRPGGPAELVLIVTLDVFDVLGVEAVRSLCQRGCGRVMQRDGITPVRLGKRAEKLLKTLRGPDFANVFESHDAVVVELSERGISSTPARNVEEKTALGDTALAKEKGSP